MEFINLLPAENRREFRIWLADNHSQEKECWVAVKRGKPQENNVFWYINAVEEAMCFGWIDSITKKVLPVLRFKDLHRGEKEVCGQNLIRNAAAVWSILV